jgi:hypothetical protein
MSDNKFHETEDEMTPEKLREIASTRKLSDEDRMDVMRITKKFNLIASTSAEEIDDDAKDRLEIVLSDLHLKKHK